MSNKDNNQPQPQPQSKITADIFATPTMTTENRGDQVASMETQSNKGLTMKEMTFSKNDDE